MATKRPPAPKRAPRGPARQAVEYLDPAKPSCNESRRPNGRCGRNGTIYRAHNWWCPTHVPPDHPCTCRGDTVFRVTAPDGVTFCSWCCGILEEDK